MEIGNRIKNLRLQANKSQEVLAEEIYVSRQTISNWENNRSYPDIQSLLRLSDLFHISLDQLIKGDVEIMKQEINQIDLKNFDFLTKMYGVTLFISIVALPVLVTMLNDWGVVVWIPFFLGALYFGWKLEKIKKKYDLHTYKEILAFQEGKTLDELDKAREQGKRHYQKIMIVIGFMVVAFIIAYGVKMLMGQ